MEVAGLELERQDISTPRLGLIDEGRLWRDSREKGTLAHMKRLTRIHNRHLELDAHPYLVPHCVKIAFVAFAEVFLNILIGEIATQENTIYGAVLVTKFTKSSSISATFEKLVECCANERYRCRSIINLGFLPWRMKPDERSTNQTFAGELH